MGSRKKTLPRTSPGLWLGPEYHLWSTPGLVRKRDPLSSVAQPSDVEQKPGGAQVAAGAGRARCRGWRRRVLGPSGLRGACAHKAPAEGRRGPSEWAEPACHPSSAARPPGVSTASPRPEQAGPDGASESPGGEGRAGRAPPAERPGGRPAWGGGGGKGDSGSGPDNAGAMAEAASPGKGGPRRAERSEPGRVGAPRALRPDPRGGGGRGAGLPSGAGAPEPGAAPTTEQKTPLSGSRQQGRARERGGHRRRARVWDCSLSASCGLRTSVRVPRLPIPLEVCSRDSLLPQWEG